MGGAEEETGKRGGLVMLKEEVVCEQCVSLYV